MSTTLRRPPATPPSPEPESGTASARRLNGDALALALLALAFALVAALTWGKWGVPEIDAGAELTTADRLLRGDLPYADVRYYYGPLGLYGLAAAFKLLGTSFTTAWIFGLLQAAAILGVSYALLRQWVRPAAAGLATAVLLAIGFSGTAFNFVLPHTNSATVGVLCLLLALLALARERLLLAGLPAGLVCLTRPEFVAVAAAALLAYVVGVWREQGRREALDALWRLALPGIALPIVVYGYFATQAGLSTLLWENLWPRDFIRIAGFKTQQHWMPFTLDSFVGVFLRGGVYLGLLAAMIASVVGMRRRQGVGRIAAAWPLGLALVALGLAFAALRVTGLFSGQREAVEEEIGHLILGMTWLPALGFAAAAWAAVRFLRRESSPLGGGWPLDLALLVAAAGLGLRAYNAFATEGSYAPYYAAPLVVLLGILHQRLADRFPAARQAVLAVLGLVAVGLSAYALRGLYADQTTTVHTPRGDFVTTPQAARAMQGIVDEIERATRPGDAILAAPADGGLHFMTDRRPALYETMLLPGLLDSAADERRAIRELEGAGVRLAVVTSRDFSKWGIGTRFGRGYNPVLGRYLRGATTRRSVVGTLADPQAGTNPSIGAELLRLRAADRPALEVAASGCADAASLREARAAGKPLCNIERALALAPSGTAVSVAPGAYPALELDSGVASGRDLVVRAAGDGPVRLPRVSIGEEASGVTFAGLTLTGDGGGATFSVGAGAHHIRLLDARVSARGQEAVELVAGSHDVAVERSWIHTEQAGSGVIMDSESNVPGAPSEVEPTAPVSRVVLRDNHFDGIAIDAIRPANFRDLLVEGNEIEGVYETGAHNDVLQVVWGGRGLVFRDNLVHGNTGQGLFVKDGRVHDVTVSGNAFVRNRRRAPGDQLAASPLQLYDTVGVRIVNNTIWDNDTSVLLRPGLRDVTIENNVIENLVADEEAVGALRRAVRQDWNLMGGGWNWGREGAIGPHDVAAFERTDRQPRFVDAGALDYRLAPGSPGIDAGTAAHRPGGRGGCARAWDDPAVRDTGDATPAVDMGWRERRPGC